MKSVAVWQWNICLHLYCWNLRFAASRPSWIGVANSKLKFSWSSESFLVHISNCMPCYVYLTSIHRWKKNSCGCVCKQKQNCSNRREYFDEKSCSCRCKAWKLKGDCSYNSLDFDASTCSCLRKAKAVGHTTGNYNNQISGSFDFTSQITFARVALGAG